MKRLLLIIALLFLLLPAAVRAQGFVFPNNPVVGQEVTGPNGVVYRWDGVKWVVVPPPGSLPINNPNFLGTLTGLNPGSMGGSGGVTRIYTLPDTSDWNSVGGTIRAPISTGNGSSRITFETNRASISPTNQGLDLGGGTTYDGSAWRASEGSASIVRVGRDGVVRFYANNDLTPGGTYSPAEIAAWSSTNAIFQVPAVLNQNLAYTNDFLLHSDVNGMLGVFNHNRSGGSMAQTGFNLRNNPGNDTWWVLEGSGYVNNGDVFQQPNTAGILAGNTNNFWIATNYWEGIRYWASGRQNTSFDRYGARLRQLNNPSRSQLYFDVVEGGVLASTVSVYSDNLNMMAGGYYDNGVWWTNQYNAQLMNWNNDNSVGFYVLTGLGGTAGWVRNASWTPDALNLTQTQWGGPYDFALNGEVVSWARPWEGSATLDSHPAQLWVCNGCCGPATPNSGLIIVTETIYHGTTVAYALGGTNLMGIAVSKGGTYWSQPSCGQGGYVSMCFSGNHYYICNNLGVDTIFGVQMLMTRAQP